MNEADVPFVDTKFRMFDSYLASLKARGYLELVHLYPDEIEDLQLIYSTSLYIQARIWDR